MANPFEDESKDYIVLVNDERQYSLWPTFRDIPAGWTKAFEGKRKECLDWIDAIWTDMRPNSLIRQMDQLKARSAGQ